MGRQRFGLFAGPAIALFGVFIAFGLGGIRLCLGLLVALYGLGLFAGAGLESLAEGSEG